MEIAIALLFGYLLGSIPFAVIIAKVRGVDIFKVGSCSPGATNVKRSVGPKAGNLCFVLDALKGFVPVFIMGVLGPLAAVGALMGALLGHSFSIWIKFRGGKGVATTIGGLMAFMPIVMIGGLFVWVVTFYASRYVSLASILLALWLPIGVLVVAGGTVKFVVALLIALLIVLRHKANIKRLLNGTENRFLGRKTGE